MTEKEASEEREVECEEKSSLGFVNWHRQIRLKETQVKLLFFSSFLLLWCCFHVSFVSAHEVFFLRLLSHTFCNIFFYFVFFCVLNQIVPPIVPFLSSLNKV